MPLIGNILKPLAKRVLVTLGLTAAASPIDGAINKKIFGSGLATLIISNEEINDIMKRVKSLKESGLLIRGFVKQLKMKQKNRNEDFTKCYWSL